MAAGPDSPKGGSIAETAIRLYADAARSFAGDVFGGNKRNADQQALIDAGYRREGGKGSFHWRTPDGSSISFTEGLAIGAALVRQPITNTPPITNIPVGNAPPPAGPVEGPIGNAPSPADNFPIGTGPYWVPGSIFWGRSGPKKRFRRSTEAERRRKWRACIDRDPTDTGVARCDELYGYESEYARGPMPSIPVARPIPVPPAVATGAVARAVLGTVVRTAVGTLGSVLWPSTTASDDVVHYPAPQPLPSGPAKRPRIGQVTRPAGYPQPPKGAPSVPVPRPTTMPRPSSLPRELPPFPTPSSWPTPATVPLPSPPPAPSPTPTPSSPTWFDPLLPLLLSPFLSPAPRVPRASPLTPTQPGRAEYPEPSQGPTYLLPPTGSQTCQCEKTPKRRKRKDACNNPILRKRRGVNSKGQRTITTTRLDKCRA